MSDTSKKVENTVLDDSDGMSNIDGTSNADSTESATEVIQPENKNAPKPTVNFVSIPQELKDNCSFCLWKREKRKGGITKVPFDPRTRNMAKTNDPSTFADFNTAMKAYVMGGFQGIGIRVANGIGAIDIDHCIREDGSLNDVAASILSIFSDTYFERSPSGTGLRGFFRIDPDYVFDKTVYYINNRKLGLEVYLPGTTNRFVTVTGDCYRPGTVPLDMTALEKVLDSFMKRKTPVTASSDVASGLPHRSYLTDQQVIEHASNSSNEESSQRFRDFMKGDWQKYFDNQSDADMSFITTLCFWCGCVEEQIDRIYRSSGMMRPKWDRKQAGTTYGAITIRNAIAMCREIYMPNKIAAAEDFEDLENDGSDNTDGSDRDPKTGKKNKKKSVDFEPDLSQIKKTLKDFSPQSNLRYTQGEIGFGNLFADYYKPVARFNSDREVWYVYDGKSWRVDSGNLKVEKLAKRLADLLLIYGTTISEESVRKEFIKSVTKLQDRRKRETMIKDARSEHPLPHAALDRDEFLFNMQNGTMNLLTGEFHEHRPEDFITKISPVAYDPDATCPRFIQFMDEVMQGDKERIAYVQKALGYSLSADTKLECFFILYGATSRNGKGTLMETFLKISGDYGKNSDPLLLAMKYNQSSSGPSEELARLDGARFVNISEPEKKLVVDAALTKRLTGNDTITARYLHENSFEFKPTFKIFINTNHEPQITDDTLFTSGRVKVIPFNRHFSEKEQDKGLKAFFTEDSNMSGIFNWLLEGFRRYKSEGLEVPKSVKEATDAYQLESDRIAQFVKQCLVPAQGKELRSQAVYNRYLTWCRDDQNFKPENQTNFKKGLERFYPLERRRPWADKGGQTTMVNNVAWAEGEEPEADLAPE